MSLDPFNLRFQVAIGIACFAGWASGKPWGVIEASIDAAAIMALFDEFGIEQVLA